MAVKVAELLAVPPLEVIAAAEIERTSKPEVRKVWLRYAASILAAAGISAAVGTPTPSQAANGASVYYVKSRKSKKQVLRRLSDDFVRITAAITGFKPPRLV